MKPRAILRWIFGLPLLLLMVLFALSNRQPVRLGIFPTDFTVEVPLSVAILAALGIGFFLGGLRLWFTALRHRREARRARETARLLEARQQQMNPRPSGTASGPLLTPP